MFLEQETFVMSRTDATVTGTARGPGVQEASKSASISRECQPGAASHGTRRHQAS